MLLSASIFADSQNEANSRLEAKKEGKRRSGAMWQVFHQFEVLDESIDSSELVLLGQEKQAEGRDGVVWEKWRNDKLVAQLGKQRPQFPVSLQHSQYCNCQFGFHSTTR